MLNITTEYPLMKGESDIQLASLQSTVCNLIDELKYVLPQLDSALQSIQQSSVSESENT